MRNEDGFFPSTFIDLGMKRAYKASGEKRAYSVAKQEKSGKYREPVIVLKDLQEIHNVENKRKRAENVADLETTKSDDTSDRSRLPNELLILAGELDAHFKRGVELFIKKMSV